MFNITEAGQKYSQKRKAYHQEKQKEKEFEPVTAQVLAEVG